MLHLLRYVSSFMEGRVRLRHPALRQPAVVEEARPYLLHVGGITSVVFSVNTGSVLILYDTQQLSTDQLIRYALPWAAFLDARHKGLPSPVPSLPQGAL